MSLGQANQGGAHCSLHALRVHSIRLTAFFFLWLRTSVTKPTVRISKLSVLLVFVCLWFVTSAVAITLEMTDGAKLEGEIFLVKDDFLQIRAEGGNYPKIEWSKFSQATLKWGLDVVEPARIGLGPSACFGLGRLAFSASYRLAFSRMTT